MTQPSPPPSDIERAALLAELRRLERAARPLEPGTGRRRRLRTAAMAWSERFLRRIDALRGFVETDDNGIGLLDVPIGERGIPIERAIALFEHEVVRPGANPASAGHMAYIPGGGLYHSALGDFLAAVSNKYAGVFFAAPGAVRMENMLIRWLADLVGYPAGAAARSRPAGASATLAAVCTARDAHGSPARRSRAPSSISRVRPIIVSRSRSASRTRRGHAPLRRHGRAVPHAPGRAGRGHAPTARPGSGRG